jgi:hypothetical protein
MKAMIKTIHLLSLSSIFFFASLLFSQRTWADQTLVENNARDQSQQVMREIANYLALGEVKLAYQLAQSHYAVNDKLGLKYAQLSLILGKQKQAEDMFTRLAASKQLSAKQKGNMRRFIKGFNQAQKKKFKLVEKMVRQGLCDQARQVLKSLLIFQPWQEKAQQQLDLCLSHKLTSQFRLGYLLGWDDNIALTNEELELGSTNAARGQLLSGSYQNASVYTGLKLVLNDKHEVVESLGLESIKLMPSYYFSIRQYDNQVPSQYDQASHKLQLALKAKHGQGLELRIPSYFRYSQYAGRHYSNTYGTKLILSASSNLNSSSVKQQLLFHWREKTYAQASLQDKAGQLIELGYSSRFKLTNYRASAKLHWQELSGPSEASDRYQQSIIGIKLNKALAGHVFDNVKTNLFAGLNLKYKLYQGPDSDLVSLYGSEYEETRRDWRQDWRAGISFKQSNTKGSRWQVKTSLHYQERNSNLPLYDFKRKKLELGVQYSF